jgi:hypothetical protein
MQYNVLKIFFIEVFLRGRIDRCVWGLGAKPTIELRTLRLEQERRDLRPYPL